MSKEAKVGLLLGLMLIVGIVLVLRGLHGNEDAKFREELASQSQEANPVEPARKEVDILSAVDQLSARPTPIDMPVVVNPDPMVRYAGELPGHPSVAPISIAHPVIPSVSDPLDELKSLTEPVKTRPAVFDVIAEDRPKADQREEERIYVVGKGENLTKIALRVYGHVEGKKYKHIQAIYKANKNKMSSMDTVYPGQNLVIPPLPGNRRVVKQSVTSPGGRKDQEKAARDSGEVYLVQKYDSLWDIAEAKLGSGMRYKDIKKLNGLKSNVIVEGQTLRLPVGR